MKETKDTDSKLKSRKFLVWIVWLLITLFIILFSVITMIVTKSVMEAMTTLVEKALGWFFSISMMYLGMNVGQKAAFAFSESMKIKESESEDTAQNDGKEG